MSFINRIFERWKTISDEFERNMNDFLDDFESTFKGTNDSTKQNSQNLIRDSKELPKEGVMERCEDGGKQYQVGESWTGEECTLKVCHPRKVISIRKCPDWVAPPQCRIQNLDNLRGTYEFPQCCPSVICPVMASPQSAMSAKREIDEEKLRKEIERITKNDKSVCKSGGKTYKVGQTWRDKGKCEVRACHPGGLISVMPCPRFVYDKKKPRPDCQVVAADASLDYPDCCEYVYCKPKIDKPG